MFHFETIRLHEMQIEAIWSRWDFFSLGIIWQLHKEAFCLVSPSKDSVESHLSQRFQTGLTAQEGKEQKPWLMDKVEMLPEHLQGVLKVLGSREHPSSGSNGDGG